MALNDLSFFVKYTAILCGKRFDRGGGGGCLTFVVLRMFRCCKCSVTLPRGAVGWSAVCDSGIS